MPQACCVLGALLVTMSTTSNAEAQVVWQVSSESEAVRDCFRQHMVIVPGTERELVVELSFGSDGRPVGVAVQGAESEPPLAACLEEAYLNSGQTGPADGTRSEPLTFSARRAESTGGSVGDPELRRLLVAQQPEVETCFREVGDYLSDRVEVALRVTITPDGTARAELRESTIFLPALERCLVGTLSSVVFPESAAERDRVVDYPFAFNTIRGRAENTAPFDPIIDHAAQIEGLDDPPLSQRRVTSSMGAADGDLSTCLEQRVRYLPNRLALRVVVSVAASGETRDVALRQSVDDDLLANCVAGAFRRVELPSAAADYRVVDDVEVDTQRFVTE